MSKDQNVQITNGAVLTELFIIRGRNNDGFSRYFSVDPDTDTETWTDDINKAMEFGVFAEAETYTLENLIKSPETYHNDDGSLTVILPKVTSSEVRPETIEIDRIITSIERTKSEAIQSTRESMATIMSVLENTLASYKNNS